MGPSPRSAREMAVAEANALALGLTVDALMENAGRAAAEEIARHLPPAPAKVAVVAGTGNNGGDGSCAAHYLAQWGHAPELWLVRPASEIRSASARHCFDRLGAGVPVHTGAPTAEDLSGFPLVVDALLGTGASGVLRGVYAEAAAAIRASGAPLLSIDVPSGLGTDEPLRPNWTVTFTCPKQGLDPTSGGEVTVRDIGIPDEALHETGPGEFHLFPIPPGTGRTARVLVVGGGPFAGAPALAGLAALRAGAERVTVLCPSSVAPQVQGFSPDLVVVPIGRDRFRPMDLAATESVFQAHRHHALILGMGAGRDPETIEYYTQLLATRPEELPVLVDADALDATAAPRTPARGGRRLVLTPNAGELSRLTGVAFGASREARAQAAEQLARDRQLVVLAKGDPDLIAGGGEPFANLHHHPAATVGGVGDVLSGVVGSLLAQGLDPVAACRLGSYWVGEAGMRRFETEGYGMLASDVIDEIPRALADGLRRIRS